MYWLIISLILTAILGTLSVATSVALPNNIIFSHIDNILTAPLILITIAILLILINQRRALSSTNIGKKYYKNHSSIFFFITHTFYYLLMALLIIMLVSGSALQALNCHQQVENKKISESVRVQALVDIEGVSDSVYDPATNSGYRQIATIKYLSLLVSELTTQDLDVKASTYIENSLSHTENSAFKSVEYRVLLTAYPNKSSKNLSLATLNDLQPGDQLLMTLALAPLITSQETINNPTGFDSYRWLRGRHIDGVANIIAVGTPSGNLSDTSSTSLALATIESTSYFKRLQTLIDQGRWQLRQHFYQNWSTQTTLQQQANAVTLSLLTGDRSLINRDTKDLYQLAGISHLLAISGTHVLFLAIMLAGLVVLLFNRLCPVMYQHVPRWQLRWLVMISAAFIYALFTGFDVPAARTVWMLLAIGMVRLTLLPISTMRVLLALAVLMAWVDPYVLWQAGYWLSFIAVALLLKYDNELQVQAHLSSSMPTHPKGSQHSKKSILYIKVWSLCKRVFKLQCWLFIALLPITLLLFGKASLWGLVINLFAIGLFGWVIVPLNLLAGLFYLLLPSVADSLWNVVSAIVARLHELIIWLTALPTSSVWLHTPVNTAIILMAGLVILPWLLPRGLISRGLALPPLALLVMTLYANQQKLTLTPTLYILPTGDRYLSAAILQYPLNDKEFDKNNKEKSVNKRVSLLFLADHRPSVTLTMPSSLTANKLSALLEQQLRTLSVKHLEGVIVQTGVIALTDALPLEQNNANSSSELLPTTVAQLSQRLPTNQYWQAGRHERWSARQQLYATALPSKKNPKSLISAQDCAQGKTWQSANGQLSLKALTGWNKIEDSSVWDCTVAIDSTSPIRVLQYNAANPLQSLPLIEQVSMNPISFPEKAQKGPLQSRLILDAATQQRVWQLWSLLCTAQPFALDLDSNAANGTASRPITWLSHSASQVPASILSAQKVSTVLTYDSKPLDIALTIADEP